MPFTTSFSHMTIYITDLWKKTPRYLYMFILAHRVLAFETSLKAGQTKGLPEAQRVQGKARLENKNLSSNS